MVILASLCLFAQAPKNDYIQNTKALNIGVDQSNEFITGTNFGASDSSQEITSDDELCGNYLGRDKQIRKRANRFNDWLFLYISM